MFCDNEVSECTKSSRRQAGDGPETSPDIDGGRRIGRCGTTAQGRFVPHRVQGIPSSHLRSGPNRLEPSADLAQPTRLFEPGERHRRLAQRKAERAGDVVECSWRRPGTARRRHDRRPATAGPRVERRRALAPRVEAQRRQHVVGRRDRRGAVAEQPLVPAAARLRGEPGTAITVDAAIERLAWR